MHVCVYNCVCINFIYVCHTCVVAVVTTESSSAGDGHPQQDGGDVGASVIDHLPAGVSAQCECNTYVAISGKTDHLRTF